MRYLWQHIFTILGAYNNSVPLHYYLKQYYRNQPKLGSRDRRGISDAVYAWYRCGKAFQQDVHTLEEQVLAALFLCDLRTKALQNRFPESWEDGWNAAVNNKLVKLADEGYDVDLNLIFPPGIEFSTGISKAEWIESMLQQPKLFLRVRKNKEKIAGILKEKEIAFEWMNDSVLALPNGISIDNLLLADSYVIQDASSQATADYFKPKPNEKWWDCCSGAGGKSLLLKDLEPSVALLATDVRDTILHNLKERFKLYHLHPPRTLVVDASDIAATTKMLGAQRFDGIISDVPCTGAGTWARTPEQLYFFDVNQLNTYTNRQEAILSNALNYVAEGGKLVYITCSTFKAENESVVEKIAVERGWDIESMQLINGISQKADCLFVAVLKKNISTERT